MTNFKFDKITSVDIGFDNAAAANFVVITNVLYFAERIVAVEGDMVTPLTMINDFNPGGVHDSHKYLELELCLDTDWLTDSTDRTTRWAYTQHVNAADTLPAIVSAGFNTAIEYFVVNIREYDGTATVKTYADEDTNVLWCVSEISDFSNEDNTPHQTTTFKFICLQDVT